MLTHMWSGSSSLISKLDGKNATWSAATEIFSPFLADEPVASSFAEDVERGFSQSPKRIPSRWFYDSEGSRLFSRITELDEYYPTEAEASILRKYAGVIAERMLGEPWIVTELGAGDGRKTEILLSALVDFGVDIEFWPIDLSGSALDELCKRMTRKVPGLKCHPVLADNRDGLAELAYNREGRRALVLFLGSSVGNCERPEVYRFLRELRGSLDDGDLALIGFDLQKDVSRLQLAYSDLQGVTRDFNLNLLARMNRELGADFDLHAFRHEATWNPWIRGMESWLVSTKEQSVHIEALGRTYDFGKWEAIHTEISLKFHPREIGEMAEVSGFRPLTLFVDDRADFADALWGIVR